MNRHHFSTCIRYRLQSQECNMKAVIAKIIPGVPDYCPAGLQRSARHFEPLSDIFPSWWLANISGHSSFPCLTFYVYWTLLDKMAGNVLAPCRTSAAVCRTCPACPAYFAITAFWKCSTPMPFVFKVQIGTHYLDYYQLHSIGHFYVV